MSSFHDASQALGAELVFPEPSDFISGVAIDSRLLKKGNLFIAIKTDRNDGHSFLEAAFSKGASGALVSKQFWAAHGSKEKSSFRNMLVVEDPSESLKQLARYYRSCFNIPAVGITGSVGKTSTKEFLVYLLKQQYKVHATRGNFNNALGLPMTLLDLKAEHEVCVAELGANHLGEIQELSQILKPSVGIITQIAPAHLEGFGSIERVREAKSELLESLDKGGAAILPDHDRELFEKAVELELKPILVGQTGKADYHISHIQTHQEGVGFKLNEDREFWIPHIPEFLVPNAVMAIAASIECGLSDEKLPSHWQDVCLPGGRFERQQICQNALAIFDGYNSSPASFEAAIKAFQNLAVSGRRILVFSDMLELGKDEVFYHEKLGEQIADSGFDCVVAYGTLSQRSIQKGLEKNPRMMALYFETPEAVTAFLKDWILKGDAVLFKASRGMEIEQVLNPLRVI